MTHSLDELQTLCDAATPGPWHVQHYGTDGLPLATYPNGRDSSVQTPADAAFIAAARTALPELIARCRELEQHQDWLRVQTGVALSQVTAERDAARAEVEQLKTYADWRNEQVLSLSSRAEAAERRVAEQLRAANRDAGRFADLDVRIDALESALRECREVMNQLRRGCDCAYDHRCLSCDLVLKAKGLVPYIDAALAGEGSK